MSNLIRLPDVISRCAISRSAMYQMIKDGAFPAPIRVQRRAVAWVETEINGWIEQRIAASRGGPH
jgi:prophage regulatory protein